MTFRKQSNPKSAVQGKPQEIDRLRAFTTTFATEDRLGLGSNVTDWSGEELWRAYNQLKKAEEAFRLHMSDLVMRPVWHQKQHRVQAHILICFLAYVLWKTLGMWCQRAGLGDEPRKIFSELQQISLVDVLLPTRAGVSIRKRCVSRPTDHQAILLQCLGLQIPAHIEFADL